MIDIEDIFGEKLIESGNDEIGSLQLKKKPMNENVEIDSSD